jgi:hypothetical protein
MDTGKIETPFGVEQASGPYLRGVIPAISPLA